MPIMRRASPGWRAELPVLRDLAVRRLDSTMLSRVQEARVREVLSNSLPGSSRTYCLEHLAVSAKVPPSHIADLAVFVRSLRESGDCQTRYGGRCEAEGHDTRRLLAWGPPARFRTQASSA